MAVQYDDKIHMSRPFRNTPRELIALVRLIIERCPRPKICLRLTSPTALKLLKFISDIPDAEVVLISDAGLKLHQTWLSKKAAIDSAFPEHASQAVLLTCCAERMI